jgi:hypothetical protein
MRRRGFRGSACIEFAFIVMVLVPLLLGTGAAGINMILTLQTIQLARDAGHMYAHGLDFSQTGNQTILANIGSTLGLSTTAGSGSAVVILSALTYVDNATCSAAGAVDSHGNPSGCTNLGKWVFTQRLTIGNSSVRTGNIGSPLTSGTTGVTVNSTTGRISVSDYATKAGAVATFSSINPYSSVNGVVSGLPSGQMLYVAEAGATAFSMPPFIGPHATYSYGLF